MESLAKEEQGLDGGLEITNILRRKTPSILIDKMFCIIVLEYSVWNTNERILISYEFGSTVWH